MKLRNWKRAMKAFDTWKCHVCGDERPDARVSVLSKPLIIKGQVIPGSMQNIRYCNDRQGCIEGAKKFSFFNSQGSGALGEEVSHGDTAI